ncbi:MAG TPA: NAD-dependent malic enzyme [Candidatus Binatia bacterium]|jgi:malic enzyme|nr:NAD-dependent malic enzyme [Candidatus Binatia bacterium]
MEHYQMERLADGRVRVTVPHRGARLLGHAMFNKSTAFTPEERRRFGLEGLLPPVVSTMEQQARRAYENIVRKPEPLERYIGLAALQDRNEHLFYRVLLEHLEELLPIVYTPVVGEACQQYSRIFRRARGVWITPEHRGRIAGVLAHVPYDDVRLIVVTDNERILGLGDQGAGGMGIPIGKLSLYTAAAGIHPATTLPISLDVGTDNRALLDDELYIGWRHPRLRGAEYDALLEEFVHAVQQRFPHALLQWEDFKKGIAFALLERYRHALPSFNDDIQGTAAVTVAALLAGTRVSGIALRDQRVVILGAGAAGVGIGRLIRRAMAAEGLAGDALLRAVVCLDSKGLVVDDGSIRDTYKRELAWSPAIATSFGLAGGASLADVVRALRPTALIGTSGEPDTFTEDVVREMAKHVERPLVLPLSNPTSQCEAKPADVLAWTNGRALVATGSPFEPVQFAERTFVIGQGNNAFVFPGIGLGAIVAEAREVTDGMLEAAARRLAAEVTDDDLASGSLFPPIRRLRTITATVAEAVVAAARDEGVGRVLADAAIPGAVAAAMWEPVYPELVAGD